MTEPGKHSPSTKDTKIHARDGHPLAATVWRPPVARRVAIINSATGVPRGFYRHFGMALAEAGYMAIAYDYRGTGDSAPKHLKGCNARMRDWALLDMTGVIDWVRTHLEPEKLFLVGHSIGGQAAGLIDNADAIDGMITMSAQSGYWRLQGGEQKYLTGLHVHVTLPLLSRLFGYMPWSRLNGGLDLPKGVALEFARWCRDPDYLLGDRSLPLHRYRQFTAPVLAYSFGDDKWGTRESVDAMMKAYPNVERRHVEPAEAGLDRIGHVGFFRPASKNLWAEAIDWLAGN
ncbi:MAG: alpha/beta fold hydrolase [Xanthomonadales bacterium]|nr:alpha/beta fold hydrolase [Xanthomonadales bacterium]